MAKKVEQQSLIPDEQLKITFWHAHIDALPKNVTGPEPDAAMIRSVRQFGLLQPIVVVLRTRTDPPHYEVIDGRRRLKAAREAELDRVPTLIVENANGVPMRRVLTIVANRRRSMNWQSEFAAVEELLGKGYSEAQLIEATGIGKNELRRLLRLRQLVNSLRLAFVDGELSASVAEAAAKLPSDVQHRLSKKLGLHGDGRITLKDVKEAMTVEVRQHAAELPEDMFAPIDAQVDWHAAVLDKLDEVLALAPEDQVELTQLVGRMQALLMPMAEEVNS